MFKRNWHKFAFFLLSSCLALWAAGRIFPSRPLSRRFSSSTAIYDANHKLLRLTLSADEKYRLWAPLENISPRLVQAMLLHEDQHFYSHFGLNPLSLVRAGLKTYLAGGRRMGGSTITMQLARLLYHINSRTLPGKARQVLCALGLELRHSKNEILEAYLNLVPYSRNIEGVGAASLIYFGKTADELTLPEALSLAVIPQSPFRRTPARFSGKPLLAARKALYAKWVANIRAPGKMRRCWTCPWLSTISGVCPSWRPIMWTACWPDTRQKSVRNSRHARFDHAARP